MGDNSLCENKVMRGSLPHIPFQKQVQVYLSNKLENLYTAIRANLFLNSSPFSQRWVLVPSMQMEEWLSWRLASDEGIKISAGINFSFLSHGISKLTAILFEKPLTRSDTETLLILKLFEILSGKLTSTDPLFNPLKTYLNQGSQKKKEERLFGLASRLAPLFLRYPLYGEEMVKKWMKEPKNWQESIYKTLFEKKIPLSEEIASAAFKEKFPFDFSIHLFSFSHLPRPYFSLFEKIATKVPVFLYHFSPCEIFWTDSVSEKGKRWLVARYKKKEVSSASLLALLESLDEAHPLLANLGKIGKKFAYQVEEREYPTHELYDEKIKPTLLGLIQRDILLLESHSKICPNDDSIEIHSHSTLHREIENLAERLQGENPGEVLVLAKDIALYEPFIKAHFKHYKITDLPSGKKNQTVAGLFILLSLSKRKWSSLAILELFDHPLFRQKQGITDEEVSLIRKWVQETGIRWGLESGDQKCSWRDGIDKLFLLLCTWEDQVVIDITHVDLLEKLILILKHLEQDLTPFFDGTRKTLTEWRERLLHLVETYFEFLPDEIKKLEELGGDYPPLPFNVLFPLVEKELGKESVTVGRNLLGCVTFSSMFPMRSIPAKVICLLGMDHSFPRTDTFFSLDLLDQEEADYYPTQSDFDKYLFLEALLSARSRLLISYVGQNPVDGTLIPPSPLVSELQSIVADRYGQIIKERIFPPGPIGTGNPKSKRAFLQKNDHLMQLEGDYRFTLQELTWLSRSPIRHYFKETLHIHFKDKKEIKEEEEFVLTPYLLAKMRKDLLLFDQEKVKEEAKRRGMFPVGPFGDYAEFKLRKEVEGLKIPHSEKMIVGELSEIAIQPEKISPNHWLFPPLKIELSPRCVVSIVGKVGPITSEGLYISEKKGVKEAVAAWPNFLIFSALPSFGSKELIFGRDHKVCSPFFNDPFPLLRKLLEFSIRTKKHPYLFLPAWVAPLIKKDEKKLALAISQSVSFDPAMKWLSRRGWDADSMQLIEEYHGLTKWLYGDMIDAWF